MATELSVQLTADIRALVKALKIARGEIAETGEISEKTAAKIAKLGNKPAASMKKLTGATANATPTLQEFSRVIQDAPFGIQGIGNNITQLTSNFGALTTKVGGAKAAFRLLLGSLAGPAGVLFVVSTVVTLLTVFGGKLSSLSKKSKSTKEAIEDLNKKLKETQEPLKADLRLNSAIEKNLKLQGLSTDDIRKKRIELLAAQIKNVEATITEARALLTLKKTQNEVVSDWELLSALVKQSLGIALVSIKAFYDLTKQAGEAITDPLRELLNIDIDRSKFAAASKKDKEDETKLSTELVDLEADRLGLVNSQLELQKAITEEIKKQGRAPIFGSKLPATSELEEVFKVQNPEKLGAKLAGQVFLGIQREGAKQRGTQAKEEGTAPILQELIQFNDSANAIIQGQIAETFGQLGSLLGDALTGGSDIAAKAGQVLLAGVGNLLSQLGQLAIAIGVGLKAIKKSLETLNPIAAIAAGTALVALGSAFSKGAKSLGNSIGGGGAGAFAGGGGTIGGPRIATATAAGSGFGSVVFVIRGQDLVGVLGRNISKNQRLGGTITFD